MTKKQNLPTKTCAKCGKPMVWRKKWAKVWDEVKYCSQRCRRHRNEITPSGKACQQSNTND